jgi:HlyD family secretion protein
VAYLKLREGAIDVSTAMPEPVPERVGRIALRDTAAQDRVIERDSSGRWRWVALTTILVLLAGATVILPAAQRFVSADRSVPVERLRLATVTRGDFVRDVAVRGRVVAAIKPTIYAPAAGVVTLAVEAGESVANGAELAIIDSPELAAELEQERATLQRLETELTRQSIDAKQQELENQQNIDMAEVAITAAERELRRAQASWDERIISLQDYEKARDDVSRARLEVEHARQNARLHSESLAFELQTRALERDRQRLVVEELERQVDELRILSPVGGVVGALAIEQKAQVMENQPLMTVVDLSAYEIEIQAPQEYGDDLGLGMPVEVSFGGRTYDARITAISPEVSENQVTGRVRFAGPVPEGLRQNQRVSARILLESRTDTLVVQRGPFLDSGNGRVAYVVEDGMAYRRPVETGAASIGVVEILAGLEEGQTIVISDLGQFQDAGVVLLSD